MTESELLELFGYSPDWIAAGVIDLELLRRQYDRYEKSDDKNSEHYRNGAFVDYLRRASRLTDGAIEQVLALTDVGYDLRISRATQLIESDILSDEQFARLARTPWMQDPAVAKVHARHGLLRLLCRTGLTSATFELIQTSRDSFVHDAVLGHSQVTRDQLLWLNEFGANRSIRNRARYALRSSRHRGELTDLAAGLVGSFASRNNDVDGYWGLGLLRLLVHRAGVRVLRFDLKTATAEPLAPITAAVVRVYCDKLEQQLTQRRIPAGEVLKAEINVEFGVEANPLKSASTYGEPVRCTVVLVDHRNRVIRKSLLTNCGPHDPARETRSARVGK